MTFKHIFVHRFRDGAVGRFFCVFDTSTGRITQQRIGPNELRNDIDFYINEFILWNRAIDAYFLSEWLQQIRGGRGSWTR
jgi:hypothetical protein